jgi:plastocyanin
MMLRFFGGLAVVLVACGGDDGGGGADAPNEGAANTVSEVNPCPAAPDATVTTENTSFAYMPQTTTITQGQVVQFVMSSDHDVAPNTQVNTDAGLRVGFGATKCLRFTATGTFGYKCTPHGFVGTITVN